MNRFTKQISLVLISSSLILGGCRTNEEDKDKKDQPPRTGTHSSVPHAVHGGGGSTGSSSVSPSGTMGSTRGGFGGSAHGSVS